MAETSRQYDVELVDKIEEGKRIVDEEGLQLELRPIPDDDREYILDPRIFALTHAKLAGDVPVIDNNDFMKMRKTYSKPSLQIDSGEIEHKVEFADLGDHFIPLHIWTPANHEEDSAVLVYLHGGGFVAGMVEQYQYALRYPAELSGAVVVYPEYRLAPECAFPGPLMDCVEAIEWVVYNAETLGIDPEKVAIAGDSAGGSLVNGAVQVLARKGIVKLAASFYALVKSGPERMQGWSYKYYPITEGQQDEAKNRVDRIKNADVEPLYTLGDEELLADPLISATYTRDFAAFPRTLVVSSEYDFLRVQDEEFARKLQENGVDVRAIRYLGCDHGFFENAGTLPQTEDLCRILAEEMAKL